MTMADRERLWLQTNLVGAEYQHIALGETEIGNANVRRLQGRNVPISIPPSPSIPPEPPKITNLPYPDSAEPFDPGINLPISPTTPEQSQTAQAEKGAVPTNNSIPIPLQTKQKPPVPPRPTALSNRDSNIHRGSSEMESDDYHHISEHLQRAAAKINKTKLAITFQDKDKPPSPSPIKENIPTEDLAWDNFQMIHLEQDSVNETPNATKEKKQIKNTGQGNGSLGLNSFGTAIDTLRHLADSEPPEDPYVEELLETKRRLQEKLQEISSEGTSEGGKGKE